MRRPDIHRPVKLTTTLPENVRAVLDLYLYSEVENRIPVGAYQQFIVERILEFFDSKALDTGKGIVRGPSETISYLSQILEHFDES